MQQPCLPVPRRRKREDDANGETLVNFDNIEAMDAMEYMAAVVQQANSMPDVFISNISAPAPSTRHQYHIPIDGSAASMHYLVSNRTSVWPPPTQRHGPPSQMWVEGTLANFSELRGYLEKCDCEGVGGKETDRMPFPPMKDGAGWHEFCVGANESSGNAGSYFDDSDGDGDGDEEIDGEEGEAEAPAWKKSIPLNGHEPTVRLVLQMDQVMTRRVLAHLTGFIEVGWSPCSKQRTAWIYALLARLERPLHRDDVAMLFSLLKQLTKARVNAHVDGQEDLAKLNTLIAIVGLYFEQGGGYANIMEPI